MHRTHTHSASLTPKSGVFPLRPKPRLAAGWLWALPAFLIVSGPPLARGEQRDALASLQGSVDAWIAWQLFVYVLAGALAVVYLIRPLRNGFSTRSGALLGFCALLLLLFSASSIWSPSVVATLGMSLLLCVAMLVTAQFAYSGAQSKVDTIALLNALRLLAGAIAALVLLIHLLGFRGMAEWVPTGIRIRGGRLGTQQILGPTVYAISLYFLAFRLRPAFTQLLWIAFSLAVIWTARTRAAYITMAMASAFIWFAWIRTRAQRRQTMQKLLVTAVAATTLAALVAASAGLLRSTWYRGSSADTVSTLSHRTTIWNWTLEQVAEHPFGFGYSTGFRQMFLTMDPITADAYLHEGLVVERIGEAHNSHLEILVAAGWPGFAAYLAILGIVGFRGIGAMRAARRHPDLRHGLQLSLILLAIYLADGMTTSAYALPTRQSFGLLLFAIGMVVMIAARTRKSIGHVAAETTRALRSPARSLKYSTPSGNQS